MKYFVEQHFKLKDRKILGIDEAGRGNLAGEMVVAGCILNLHHLSNETILQINDSKKISKQKRQMLFDVIIKNSIYSYKIISVKTIEEIGPKKASLLGMNQIINELKHACEYIFVDYEQPQKLNNLFAFTHGDALSINIAAASIIAKCIKDNLMKQYVELNKQLEVYDLINNAGYGTKKHMDAIKKYGKVLNFHRNSYAPIKNEEKINNFLLINPLTRK